MFLHIFRIEIDTPFTVILLNMNYTLNDTFSIKNYIFKSASRPTARRN
jgi:hypothetical protein